jgi:TRAP-type mannitol/chloroaromatic compound transport system permease small subunit
LQRYLLWVDGLNAWVGKSFAWLILALTAITSYDILTRKFFSAATTTWGFDVAYMLYGTIFMMGGAYALSRNAHVRGDIFYRSWPVRVQGAIDLALYLLFFFPGILALVSAGTQFAYYSWTIGERSQTTLAQPPLYPLKAVIPIAATFLVIQGIAETIRAIQALRTGVWPPRLADVEETETRLAKEEQL